MHISCESLSMMFTTSYSADNAFQILKLTKETKRILPSVTLSVTVPHTLSLPDQVWKSTFLYDMLSSNRRNFTFLQIFIAFSPGQAGRAIRTRRCWHYPNRRRKMLYSIKGRCPWFNRKGKLARLQSSTNRDLTYLLNMWILCNHLDWS